MSRRWMASLAVGLILLAAMATAWWLRPRGAALPPGGDFVLQSAKGPVHLSDFRGKIVLLYFGYTSCPDVCPTNLSNLAAALKALSPKERKAVQVLFISIDPERDTPGKLARYVTYFDPHFLGLSGSPDQIAEVARQYGVTYRKVPYQGALGYLMDHSSLTYVVDADGKLRATLPHAAPRDQILLILRQWMPVGS